MHILKWHGYKERPKKSFFTSILIQTDFIVTLFTQTSFNLAKIFLDACWYPRNKNVEQKKLLSRIPCNVHSTTKFSPFKYDIMLVLLFMCSPEIWLLRGKLTTKTTKNLLCLQLCKKLWYIICTHKILIFQE